MIAALNIFIFTTWFWMGMFLIGCNQLERSGFVMGSGTYDLTTESMRATYSPILSLVKIGAPIIQMKEWIWGFLLTSSSTLMAWYLTLSNGPFKTLILEKLCTLYWKCLANNSGFRLRYLHLSKKSISFMLSSDSTSPLNSAIVKRSLFNCKSAELSVIKNVGSPSCLTIAKTSCRNFF